MKLSVNEAKLTGLLSRNCATIQKVLILKFAFGSEKLSGLSRNRPLARLLTAKDLGIVWRDSQNMVNSRRHTSSCVLLLRSLSLHAFYVNYSYSKHFTLVIIVAMSLDASSFSKIYLYRARCCETIPRQK